MTINKKKVISLVRLARVAPMGDVGTEPTPAFGLAYLSAMVKSETIEVNGIDASGLELNKFFKIPEYNLRGNGLEINEVINLINPKTKIIGITSMFSHEWPYIRDCVHAIKKAFPDAKIILGGEHASALTEYSLKDCSSIDYISLGEGEETWAELCNKEDTNFDNVAGLAYMKGDEFIRTTPRQRVKHIDNIPWPDWEVFPIEPYLDNAISFGPGSGRNMPMLASRGCPYECTFCSNPLMFGRRYFVRNIPDLIKQIKYYIERYNVTGLQFYDLTAILKKNWVIEFCQALKDNNIDYWLDFGTCLGAYRDNDFIPHDTDIDISVCVKDLKQIKQIINDNSLMEKNNLKVVRNTGDILSLKLLKYNGNNTDINVRANPDDDPYIDIYIVDYKPKLDKIYFKGNTHTLPANTEEYLKYIYGETWRTPIKGKHADFGSVKKNIKTSKYFKNNINFCK